MLGNLTHFLPFPLSMIFLHVFLNAFLDSLLKIGGKIERFLLFYYFKTISYITIKVSIVIQHFIKFTLKNDQRFSFENSANQKQDTETEFHNFDFTI
jgi:hypothetical protein